MSGEAEGEVAAEVLNGETDGALWRLGNHLAEPERDRLRELLRADAAAHEVVDLRGRCQRAEDLAAECRRHLRMRDRQCDELRAEIAALRAERGGERWLV